MSGYHPSSTLNTPSGASRPHPVFHVSHSGNSTPSRSPSVPIQTSNVRGAGPSHSPAFTPAMRDRQARGKDPYAGSASDEYELDDEDYDHMDMDEYDTPAPANNNNRGAGAIAPRVPSSSSASGLFASGRARPRPPVRFPRPQHNASDSDDFDFDGFDPHSDDFIGSISAMTRFPPSSRTGAPGGAGAATGRQSGESFESLRRREHARDVLERPELLMWYAASREDSIPGTRLYYTRILCGVEQDEMPVPKSRTPRKSGGLASMRA